MTMNISASFDSCKTKLDIIKEAKWKTEMLRHRGKEQRTHTQNKKQQQQSTSGAPIKTVRWRSLARLSNNIFSSRLAEILAERYWQQFDFQCKYFIGFVALNRCAKISRQILTIIYIDRKVIGGNLVDSLALVMRIWNFILHNTFLRVS